MRLKELFWYFVLAVCVIYIVSVVVGCTTEPTCDQQPRNMKCMTKPQLEKELGNELA